MARRKKKAWNMSNPLYRYLNKKKAVKPKRRVKAMARRKSKRYSAFKRGSSMGLGVVNRGLFRPSGLLGNAIMGAGAAEITENLGVQPLGAWTGVAAGFAVGGIGGALGAYAKNMLKGSTGGSTGGYV